ncbi:MAG: D-alanyl-D-alanine carboxypeptidase, partial [Mesorhizobium sp.]
MRQRHFLNLLLAGALALPMLSGTARANPVVLFDLNSGKVLEHQDAFKRWYP